MKRCQLPVTLLLGYATYIAAKCPCDRTLGCHKAAYFASVGLASFLVWAENYAS